MRLLSPSEFNAYDAVVRAHPNGTLWQSIAWKKYQEALGREVRVYATKSESENSKFESTALVVIDRTKGGISTWEIPRGPLWSSEESAKQLLWHIVADAKRERCIEIMMSPLSSFRISDFNFRISNRHTHPEATLTLDLTQSEDQLLAQMHHKGRYNIGLARKHGVEVKKGSLSDLDAFHGLMKETGRRDHFTILQKSHYKRFLESLDPGFMLIAEHQGRPIAGLIGVSWPPAPHAQRLPAGQAGMPSTGYYYYGASSYEHRALMAPYLLQWEAIRRCKEAGCSAYDFLGISPEHAAPNDPWRGITDFKRKFGGTVIQYPPEQTVILRPLLKSALDLKRKLFRGLQSTISAPS